MTPADADAPTYGDLCARVDGLQDLLAEIRDLIRPEPDPGQETPLPLRLVS